MRKLEIDNQVHYSFRNHELFSLISVCLVIGSLIMGISDVNFFGDMLNNSANGGMKIEYFDTYYTCQVFDPYNYMRLNDTYEWVQMNETIGGE